MAESNKTLATYQLSSCASMIEVTHFLYVIFIWFSACALIDNHIRYYCVFLSTLNQPHPTQGNKTRATVDGLFAIVRFSVALLGAGGAFLHNDGSILTWCIVCIFWLGSKSRDIFLKKGNKNNDRFKNLNRPRYFFLKKITVI